MPTDSEDSSSAPPPRPTDRIDVKATGRIPDPPIVFATRPDGTVTATGGGMTGEGHDEAEAYEDLRAKLRNAPPEP